MSLKMHYFAIVKELFCLFKFIMARWKRYMDFCKTAWQVLLSCCLLRQLWYCFCFDARPLVMQL